MFLILERIFKRQYLKEQLERKLGGEEIRWKQRSWCKSFSDGDGNTKFFHSFVSVRNCMNIIWIVIENGVRIEGRELTCDHISSFFKELYSSEARIHPYLDNLDFPLLESNHALWLGKPFDEEEVRKTVFLMGRERAPGPQGYLVGNVER